MRRPAARVLLLGTLAFACARAPARVTAPEPAPAPAVALRKQEVMAVREVPVPAFSDPERRKKVEALLPAIRERVAGLVAADRLVGLAVGIVVDGELVLGEGFGVRDIGNGGTIDANTAFRIGSITKVFTAMTALRLAHDGDLDLDAPAADTLPELHSIAYPSADARRFTVRDILTHTSGLPRDPDLPPLSHTHAITRDELMQAVVGLSLMRVPGIAYEYSNLGFCLLGHVLAAARQQPYHDVIDAAILDPLGMTRTVWHQSDVDPSQLAIGHTVADGVVIARQPTRHGALDAAGGLFSTVADLARFVAWQLDAWPPRGGIDNTPLPRTVLREAQRMRALRSFSARTVAPILAESGVDGGAVGVGMTWGVSSSCEHPNIVGHNGAVDGYHAAVRLLPDHNIGLIVLGNSSWSDSDLVIREIQRILADGGALSRRAPAPLPALGEAAQRFVDLYTKWDDQQFSTWAAADLRTPAAVNRVFERLQWHYQNLGACTLGPLKRATSPWAGIYTLKCEKGKAELSLSLTTATTPLFASLSLAWLDGAAEPALQEAATAALALVDTFDEADFQARFSPLVKRSFFDRHAAMVRLEHGKCTLDKAAEIRSPEDATFSLKCARGKARVAVTLDRGVPARITGFRVETVGGAACR